MEEVRKRLSATQEVQMQMIEKDSLSLTDHITYWDAVRRENVLLCAAKHKGVHRIGPWPVPPRCISTQKAKEAIEMSLELASLAETEWGREDWPLSSVSYELYAAPPSKMFKKSPRIVDVMFDNNPGNRNWYTCWEKFYMRTPDGWRCTQGGADGEGLYYRDLHGDRIYFKYFADDAKKYSTTGQWQVKDKEESFVSSTTTSETPLSNSRPSAAAGRPPGPTGRASTDQTDGEAPLPGLHTDLTGPGPTACVSVPHPDLVVAPCVGPIRKRSHRPTTRAVPYTPVRGPGRPSVLSTTGGVQSAVPESVARPPEIHETPPSPDSSEIAVGLSESTFDLFSPSTTQPCLLIQGTPNQVKCYRYRLRKHHRTRYAYCTTTWWTASDTGSERHGQATILLTFSGQKARADFLTSVSLPFGMTVKSISVTCDT
ncbi:early protein E2 [Camelus dromedarius papillomavirus 3]|nr:early protein E2 [Camelus dromedarius papillomavirus 3]